MVDAKASCEAEWPPKPDFPALQASGYPSQSPKEITSITKRYEDSTELRLEKSERPGPRRSFRFDRHGRKVAPDECQGLGN
jgi:hypothetical protein